MLQLRKQVGCFRDEIEVKKALVSGDALGAADRADLASKRKQVMQRASDLAHSGSMSPTMLVRPERGDSECKG